MDKTYIGIDPGEKGFITVGTPDGQFQFFSIADHTELQIASFLGDVKRDCPSPVAAMEDVHAIFGSSAKATFNFGRIVGLLQGLLIANHIPYVLVPPKAWQGEIWGFNDKVYRYKVDGKKMVDTKGTSFNAAHRLYPDVDLRRTPACKKEDDNKCDSLLLCGYAQRKNL